MKSWQSLATIIIGCIIPYVAQSAGNAQAGFVKSQMCQGCHNITGYHYNFPRRYSVPYLGGQFAKYIESALKSYAGKQRPTKSMIVAAMSLSQQDMQDIAAYYQAQKKVDIQPPTDNTSGIEIAKGYSIYKKLACASCHGEVGTPSSDEYPVLAHQRQDYLESALLDYRSKIRKNVIMQSLVSKVTDEEIHLMASFLSHQKPGVFNPNHLEEEDS
ncbi:MULTISPECIES: c-type cytochrome [Candidatus Ichthyocystis]|uniref:c-type cytochrome n=1 Tax=Candidatus Ichthyocystis TaxID=2929841 RepID=UPI000B852E53|nr:MULTISPECIES: c-type cytochrome [Ichthyocystis]